MPSLLPHIAWVLLIVQPVACYPSGAPSGACASMTPNHGYNPMTTPCPYQLTANVQCFQPGQRVLLSLQDPVGQPFKGMLVQARITGDANVQSYGMFDVNNNTDIRLLDCFGSASNAITHALPNLKQLEQFGWTAPQQFNSNDVEFEYTVVQVYNTFWVLNKFSLPLCTASKSSAPDPQSTEALFPSDTTIYSDAATKTSFHPSMDQSTFQVTGDGHTTVMQTSSGMISDENTINIETTNASFATFNGWSNFGDVSNTFSTTEQTVAVSESTNRIETNTSETTIVGINSEDYSNTKTDPTISISDTNILDNTRSIETNTPVTFSTGSNSDYSNTKTDSTISISDTNILNNTRSIETNTTVTFSTGGNSEYSNTERDLRISITYTNILDNTRSTETNTPVTFSTGSNSEYYSKTDRDSTILKSDTNVLDNITSTKTFQITNTKVTVSSDSLPSASRGFLDQLTAISRSTTSTSSPGGSLCVDSGPECSSLSPAKCYNLVMKDHCCLSCSIIESSNYPGCEYGDRISICGYFRYPMFCQYYGRECCSSCRNIN